MYQLRISAETSKLKNTRAQYYQSTYDRRNQRKRREKHTCTQSLNKGTLEFTVTYAYGEMSHSIHKHTRRIILYLQNWCRLL